MKINKNEISNKSEKYWMHEIFYYIIYLWNTYTKIKPTISNDKSATIFIKPFRWGWKISIRFLSIKLNKT